MYDILGEARMKETELFTFYVTLCSDNKDLYFA